MKLSTIAAALTVLCAAQPALSRDPGTINQAGAYEQAMKFYLHPAHFFWSSVAPHREAAMSAQHEPGLKNEAALMTLQPHPAERTRPYRVVAIAQPGRQ